MGFCANIPNRGTIETYIRHFLGIIFCKPPEKGADCQRDAHFSLSFFIQNLINQHLLLFFREVGNENTESLV